MAVEAYIREGYACAQRALFLPLDADGMLAGVARFARAAPPLRGRVSTWLRVNVDLAVEMAVFYMQVTVIRTGQYLVVQVVGIPMGGPPCSQYCDIYLDHYEYGLACRIQLALESAHASVVRLASSLALCLQHMFRYADDLMALAPRKLFSQLMDPSAPRSAHSLTWLYPLRDANGDTILSFEAEPPISSLDGSEKGHFLCLWVTLSKWSAHGRKVSFAPYNVRHGFDFVYPALTRYDSFTPESVLRAALCTMVPYAIMGSSSLEDAYGFLRVVCDRLWANGYPRAVLLSMWASAYVTAQGLPCVVALHRQLPHLDKMIQCYLKHDLPLL